MCHVPVCDVPGFYLAFHYILSLVAFILCGSCESFPTSTAVGRGYHGNFVTGVQTQPQIYSSQTNPCPTLTGVQILRKVHSREASFQSALINARHCCPILSTCWQLLEQGL